MSTTSITYGPQHLKGAFPELQKVDDYVLIPLFDTTFGRWVKQAKDGNLVTDAREIDSRTRYFVVGGKLVELAVSWTDIDWDDEDESWDKVSELDLSGDGRAVQRMTRQINAFVSEQDLGSLVRAAGASLKKGKTDHLRDDVREFYLRSRPRARQGAAH